MPTVIRAFALGAVLLLLAAGCASGPLKTEGVARDLDPGEGASPEHVGATVLWGGVVVNSENLADRTRLEIVGYPLDEHSQRPLTEAEPQGRFLAYRDGYLETAEYGRGRRVTVRGEVTGSEEGRIGEARYTYPAVAVEQLELWQEPRERSSRPRFHFGIGVILGN
ncbi:MAG: Slp family lipoprotein [Halofilum sp. (in: g-proteobacteria)]